MPITSKLLLLLTTTLLSSTLATELTDFMPRVVGGTEVNPPFKYPWIVALSHGSSLMCGGTLIHPSYILTAAHCSVDFPSDILLVHLHRHDLTASQAEENGLVRRVTKVIVHPAYNAETQVNDFAVWKMDSPVEGLEAVTLDSAGTYENAGTPVLIMGWGTTSYQGSPSSILLEANVEVSDFSTCNAQWNNQLDSAVEICAGVPQGGVDTCQGDSGGPLLAGNPGGGLVQIGVVSFGKGCADPNTPGIYSYVYGGRDFIQNAQDDSKTSNCASNPCPDNSFCIESVDTYFCNSASLLGAPLLLIVSLALLISFFRV